jgi:hypothetical protein
MALMNTKKSSLFVKSGASLPVPPANFLEVTDEFTVNPQPTIEEFNRISSKLGTTDSYADTCSVTFNQSVSHMMRSTNVAADALDTVPEYGEILKVCGFDETIDTATPGQETVIYTNSQAPVRGSGVVYVDGNKFTMTDTVVGDATFNFEIGKPGMIDASLQGFIDNKGIPSTVTLTVDDSSGLSVGDTVTGDTSGATGTVVGIPSSTVVELNTVTGTFQAEAANAAAFNISAVASGNPSVTLSDESLMIVSCGDVITAGGTAVKADNISITMGADIQQLYALGLKEFNINDYVIKLTADFYVDSENYSDAITKLNNETAEAIVIKLGTDQTGSLINGKSIEITADVAKASTFSDTVDSSRVKRSFTWLLRPNGSDVNLSIKHGYFS